MRLRSCASCDRLIRVAEPCPHCGAITRVVSDRPAAWIVSALCLPLMAATACQSTGSKDSPATTAAPKKDGADSAGGDVKADPPKPAEPMGEIYGTPEMIDERGKERVVYVPGPEDAVDKPEPEDEPTAPIYGGPEMDDPRPDPAPEPKP